MMLKETTDNMLARNLKRKIRWMSDAECVFIWKDEILEYRTPMDN